MAFRWGMSKKHAFNPGTDLDELDHTRQVNAWRKAGCPPLDSLAVLSEALELAYEHGGPIAAAPYANQILPYTKSRLSAQTVVTRDELDGITSAQLAARITESRARTKSGATRASLPKRRCESPRHGPVHPPWLTR